MKSFLIASALALAVHGSSYYIANYSAGTSNVLVAYPLRVCVPNGAVGYHNMVFDCHTDENGTTTIYYQKYEQGDTECASAYTDGYLPISAVPGMYGFASCTGPRSFLEIMQYSPSCNSWEAGYDGIAKTVIAGDACVFYGMMSGFSVYSRTVCDGNQYTTYAYLSDFSCSVPQAIVQVTTSTIGCHFYKNTTLGPVYSSLSKCIVDDENKRCNTPISKYSSHVQFSNLRENVNTWDVYAERFPYATLALKNISKYDKATKMETIAVNASFCTEWEDKKYGKYFKTLADYTLKSPWINDTAEICAECVFSYCSNSTMCGGSTNCGSDCVPEEDMTTTPMETSKDNKSAAALFVSFFTFFFTLLFSVY